MHNSTENLADKLINQFDQALKTLIPGSRTPERDNPSGKLEDGHMDESNRRQAAALMRVNHTGEVCAQALYQGQALTAQLPEVRESMDKAAREEIDHLSWCEDRLQELASRPSLLNPFWYSLSYGLGAMAGLAGDRWSLGFVAETETQVCRHLQEHLEKLPAEDNRSRGILESMLSDESRHAETAREAGAAELPFPVKTAMTAMAQVMKTTAYRI